VGTKTLTGAVALLAAVALHVTPADARLERARCSPAQPARAQLACGRANVRRGSTALRFLRRNREAGDQRSRASVRRSGRYLVRYGRRHVRQASIRLNPGWPSREMQIAAAVWTARRASRDPWPNCPDPIWDGAGSWQDTAGCENHGVWGADSNGSFCWGLQFDPGTWDTAARALGFPSHRHYSYCP
jgi:hypothetical protein